jgi:hypothetical protein
MRWVGEARTSLVVLVVSFDELKLVECSYQRMIEAWWFWNSVPTAMALLPASQARAMMGASAAGYVT